jgi:putative phosphoribosyl transferase
MLLGKEEENVVFQDRADAGYRLARELQAYAGRKGVMVLGIPRSGVPVAFEVAKALQATLDIFVSRKLGVPGQEELAFGAVANGGNHARYPRNPRARS